MLDNWHQSVKVEKVTLKRPFFQHATEKYLFIPLLLWTGIESKKTFSLFFSLTTSLFFLFTQNFFYLHKDIICKNLVRKGSSYFKWEVSALLLLPTWSRRDAKTKKEKSRNFSGFYTLISPTSYALRST